MNGNTPDRAELKEKIYEKAFDRYDSPTMQSVSIRVEDILSLIAQQPSSQAIERASISDTLFALKEIKHSDYSRELIDFKIKTLEEDLKARLTKPNETGSKV
jgi:hypothetical protein